MITDPTPPADPTSPEAEPNRPASRFDQRGIALQTVIIMVVLLAIAGGVAAVLMTRAGTATEQLEQQSFTADLGSLTKPFCESSGYEWNDIAGVDYCARAQFGAPYNSATGNNGGAWTATACREAGFGFSTNICTDMKP